MPARLGRGAAVLLLLAGILAGCTGRGAPPGHEAVTFASHDYVFLDDLLAGAAQPDRAAARRVSGVLGLPQNAGSAPVPAAVILHSSSGVTELEWAMARELHAMGIASLVVDSFTPRGVYRSGDDQTKVTEAAMMADAYGALTLLGANSRIRRDRIALIGFSKGATVAFYAAMADIAEALGGAAGPRFAAHIAYYPWCGLSLFQPRTTGAPILLHMGERDTMTSPALCRDRLAQIKAHDPQARIDLALYDGARHAFNHPALIYIPPLTMDAQNPGACRIVETAPGQYRETSSDRRIDHASYRAVLAACLGHGGLVSYDSAATAHAAARSQAFLQTALQPAGARSLP